MMTYCRRGKVCALPCGFVICFRIFAVLMFAHTVEAFIPNNDKETVHAVATQTPPSPSSLPPQPLPQSVIAATTFTRDAIEIESSPVLEHPKITQQMSMNSRTLQKTIIAQGLSTTVATAINFNHRPSSEGDFDYNTIDSDTLPDFAHANMDLLTIIWYFSTLFALIAFFIVMACSDRKCRRNQKIVEQQGTPPPTPAPSYREFAPPSYDTVMNKNSTSTRSSSTQLFFAELFRQNSNARPTIMPSTNVRQDVVTIENGYGGDPIPSAPPPVPRPSSPPASAPTVDCVNTNVVVRY